MIVGVGTDLCDVRRIQAVFDRQGMRLPEKILGPQELPVFQQRLSQVPARGVAYLASRFAAKEAFAKAIGLGMRAPMGWRQCEVISSPEGQPSLHLHGVLAQWFEARPGRAHISLSDEVGHALAFVVVSSISLNP